MDSLSNVYAVGNTYSPAYSNGEQDIAVFQFDSAGELKWGRYWGSSYSETATAIALDEGEGHFYVSGYSNSINSLSVAKYDMFVIKFVISTGLVQWARRFGFDNNDKANSLFQKGGFLYVVGESDSTGWTSSKTDIVFLKLDSTTAATQYGKYLGGSQEDTAISVIVDSDNTIYTLGEGFSVELTYGTKDIFLIHQNSDGSLDYFYNFGGTNPDYGTDMKLWVNTIYILGHSQSSSLSQGFLDIFIVACSKSDPSRASFVKYIGTPSFNELGSSLAIQTDGSVWLMGQISANSYTNGNNDILIASLTKDGKTNIVEYMGSTISETPGDLVWNERTK